MARFTFSDAATTAATFNDVVTDSETTATWYRLWTGTSDTDGNWVDTGSFNEYGDGWIESGDLDKLDIDYLQEGDTELWIQPWNKTDGSGKWAEGDVDFSTASDADITTSISADTAMDNMFTNDDETSDTWYNLWVGNAAGDSGSFVDTGNNQGWVKAGNLSSHTFALSDAGNDLWVETWTPEDGSLGWNHWAVSESGGAVTGDTFTLTNGPDTDTGTSKNDRFDGTLDDNGNVTFQSFDTLDGGGGTEDQLVAQNINNLTTQISTLQNIEYLHFVSPGTAAGANTIDLTNTSGVTKIISEAASTGAMNFNGIGSDIEHIQVISPVATQNFTFAKAAVSGTDDSLKLSLQGVTQTVDLVGVGSDNFETVNLDLDGGASNFALDASTGTGSLATVNVDATNRSTIDLDANVSPTTVNASDSTGNLTLEVGNNVDSTVTGGSGNDVLSFAGFFDKDDTVDGGDGTDYLGANAAQFAAFTAAASNVSNIERLFVEDDLSNSTIDMDYFSGVDYIRFADDVAGSGNIDDLASGSTLRFDNNFSGAGLTAHTINVKNAAAGTADSLSLDLRGTAETVQFKADDVESFDVTTANAGGANTLKLTDNDAAGKGNDLSLTLAGNQDLTLNLTSDHTNVTVDGSSMSGDLTADLSAVTGGPATLKGGSGNDILTGGVGADTLTGNDGTDNFVFNNFGAADEITDFSATADDIVLDVTNAPFNAAATPNGISAQTTGGAATTLKFFDTNGSNVTGATMAVTAAATYQLTSMDLFTAANKAQLTADVLSAVTMGDSSIGFALGKVGNDLYGLYITGPAVATPTAVSVKTLATVGSNFTFGDITLA